MSRICKEFPKPKYLKKKIILKNWMDTFGGYFMQEKKKKRVKSEQLQTCLIL